MGNRRGLSPQCRRAGSAVYIYLYSVFCISAAELHLLVAAMKNGSRSTSAGGSAEMAPDQTHTRTLELGPIYKYTCDTACHTGQTRNKMLPDKAIRRPPVARDVYSWGAVCHEMPCEGAAALAVRVRATTRAGVPNETKVNVQFVSALHVPAYDCLRSTLDAAVPAVANPSRRVPEKPSVGGGARPAASARTVATDPRATAGPGGLRMRPTRAGAPAAASDALRCHATTADTDAASALVASIAVTGATAAAERV